MAKATVTILVQCKVTVEDRDPQKLLQNVNEFQKLPFFPDAMSVTVRGPKFTLTDEKGVVTSVSTEFGG